MALELYVAFIAATAVLLLIPGPNVALIVANSVAHGWRYGLLTVAGTSAAMVCQLGLAILGMTSLMTVLASWFEWLRWIGVAYLLYLGVRAWIARPVDLTEIMPQPRSASGILLRGFLISLTNPKTLFFYGAFLPQFISPHAPPAPQLAALSLTFLVMAVMFDSGWALTAARFRGLLALHGGLRNRITGGVFIAAALGLASARRVA